MSAYYLAARWSRIRELRTYATRLEDLGHKVTSRWLWRTDENCEDLSDDAAASVAAEDLADVLAADTVLLFTETPRQTKTRGGRLVEMGFALGRGKTVVTIGPAENIFCTLPALSNFPSFQDFDRYLRMPQGFDNLADCIAALEPRAS